MSLARRAPPLASGVRRLPDPSPGLRRAGQTVRAVVRAALFAIWTVLCGIVQSVLLRLPGQAKRDFARLYWAVSCRLFGLLVRRLGQRATGRPVLFVANHTSWLDILALGGQLGACFVAKAEVGRWPVIRTIARLGRTVFVSRRAAGAPRERDDMRARFAAGDDIILFPEGTSSDGARVLPFRSAFFSIVEPRPGEQPPLIQPVTIVYDRIDGLPTGRNCRAVTSWYGEMELGRHFWQFARYRHVRASVILHRPIDPAEFASRKALAQATWTVIADAAARMRQNREWIAAETLDSLDSATPNIGTVKPA